ncbi:MAG: hypothetical protein JXI43_05400 [Tissierellales bacterium]|nr:hypothetical protein [Tissierellales bacterium]
MPLEILHGNLLDASTDAIILQIDGVKRGTEGNIARSFAQKWPDAWEEIEDEIPYPLPLGRICTVEPASECGFRFVIVASTLHHQDTLSESAKKSVVRSVVQDALQAAAKHNIGSIGSGIMTGGWRLSQESAFMAMSEGYDAALRPGQNISLNIYVLDAADFQKLNDFARSLGWR